jgi:SAM-dependent methyltransferase
MTQQRATSKMKSDNFEKYSSCYNLFYLDKDYKSEANYIAGLLGKHDVRAGNILEFGSGTGIHGAQLAELGYSVLGIELSEEMHLRAEVKKNFSSIHGDIRTVSLNQKFDAIVSLFHVVSYQVTNESLLATFRNAARHLKSEGVFIFDVWFTPAVYYMKPEVRIKTVRDGAIEVRRIAIPKIFYDQNRVDVNYTFIALNIDSNIAEVYSESHSMRHFSTGEIELIATISGFELIKSEEFLTGNAPSEFTWGVTFVLRKTAE